jgi:hypothetical protein
MCNSGVPELWLLAGIGSHQPVECVMQKATLTGVNHILYMIDGLRGRMPGGPIDILCAKAQIDNQWLQYVVCLSFRNSPGITADN